MDKNKPVCPVCCRTLCQFVKAKSIFKTNYQTSMPEGKSASPFILAMQNHRGDMRYIVSICQWSIFDDGEKNFFFACRTYYFRVYWCCELLLGLFIFVCSVLIVACWGHEVKRAFIFKHTLHLCNLIVGQASEIIIKRKRFLLGVSKI